MWGRYENTTIFSKLGSFLEDKKFDRHGNLPEILLWFCETVNTMNKIFQNFSQRWIQNNLQYITLYISWRVYDYHDSNGENATFI